MTGRQEKWVMNYATTGKGRQAAIDAGYSEKVASVVACRLLKNPEVISRLNSIREKDNRKMELTREKVLAELSKSLFRDPVGLQNDEGFIVTDLRQIPKELRTIIDGFKITQNLDEEGRPISQKIEVKLVSKSSAIDMGMKHLGAYAAEKQEQRISVDWDSLYGRTTIVDPVDEAVKQIGNDAD